MQQHMTHPFDSSDRTLTGLQVRGQESEVDLSVPLESSDHGPSQLDPGGNAPGDFEESGQIDVSIGAVGQVKEPVVEDGVQVTLKSLQSEQQHHAALEVDRYADVLLAELGVSDKIPIRTSP